MSPEAVIAFEEFLKMAEPHLEELFHMLGQDPVKAIAHIKAANAMARLQVDADVISKYDHGTP